MACFLEKSKISVEEEDTPQATLPIQHDRVSAAILVAHSVGRWWRLVLAKPGRLRTCKASSSRVERLTCTVPLDDPSDAL